MREVINAIFYLTREGCSWRALPHDFPPKSTVWDYFARFKKDGTWAQMVDALRREPDLGMQQLGRAVGDVAIRESDPQDRHGYSGV